MPRTPYPNQHALLEQPNVLSLLAKQSFQGSAPWDESLFRPHPNSSLQHVRKGSSNRQITISGKQNLQARPYLQLPSEGHLGVGALWKLRLQHHVVLSLWQVATRRTRTAGKVEIPNVDDHVSKLEHMGKETVKKLQDIKGAAIQAGVDINIPENCINKGAVAAHQDRCLGAAPLSVC